MKFQLNWSKYLQDIGNEKLLFFSPYLRRAVGKIVGKKQLVTSLLVRWKKAGNSKQSFRVDLAQEWFVRQYIIICPKKFKFDHNVFEVTELCRTRADI